MPACVLTQQISESDLLTGAESTKEDGEPYEEVAKPVTALVNPRKGLWFELIQCFVSFDWGTSREYYLLTQIFVFFSE